MKRLRDTRRDVTARIDERDGARCVVCGRAVQIGAYGSPTCRERMHLVAANPASGGNQRLWNRATGCTECHRFLHDASIEAIQRRLAEREPERCRRLIALKVIARATVLTAPPLALAFWRDVLGDRAPTRLRAVDLFTASHLRGWQDRQSVRPF